MALKNYSYSPKLLLQSLFCLLIGGIISCLILFFDAGTSEGVNVKPDYASETAFDEALSLHKLWLFSIAVSVVVSVVFVFELFFIIKKIRRIFDYPQDIILKICFPICGVVCFLLILPFIFRDEENHFILNHHHLKLGIINLVNGIAASAIFAGILVTGNIAYNFRKQFPDDQSPDYYFTLQRIQQSLLLMVGFQLTVGIAATALQHEIQIKVYGPGQNYITSEAVALYGLFYSLVIAVFYIPSRREIIRYGNRIVDRETGNRPHKDQSWAAWKEEREIMKELFSLEFKWKESLNAVPVLAPLLAGILPQLLNNSG